MALRVYTNWENRSTDDGKKIEPYRKYYFICEGRNTERWYFEKFISLRKEFHINALIDIRYLEKEGIISGCSDPDSLYGLATQVITKGEYEFDKEYDKIVIVFDVDIYVTGGRTWNEYESLVQNATNEFIFGITNPGFELFLLLHYPNSLVEIILPNEECILRNEKVMAEDGYEKIRYIESVFRRRAGFKPKRNQENIEDLVQNVMIAIKQEAKVNGNINECKDKITSNIGRILKMIMDDGGQSSL